MALRKARAFRLTPEAEAALHQTLIVAVALIAAIIDVVALITQISTSVASGAAVIPWGRGGEEGRGWGGRGLADSKGQLHSQSAWWWQRQEKRVRGKGTEVDGGGAWGRGGRMAGQVQNPREKRVSWLPNVVWGARRSPPPPASPRVLWHDLRTHALTRSLSACKRSYLHFIASGVISLSCLWLLLLYKERVSPGYWLLPNIYKHTLLIRSHLVI